MHSVSDNDFLLMMHVSERVHNHLALVSVDLRRPTNQQVHCSFSARSHSTPS